MDNVVIGTDTLELHEVAKVIEKSESFPVLLQGWQKFAQNLHVDEASVLEIRRKINHETISLRDAPREILKIWKAKNGSSATLNALCEALNECGLLAVTESLNTTFLKPEPENSRQFILQGDTKTLDELLSEQTPLETREHIETQLILHPTTDPIPVIKDEFLPTKSPEYYMSRTFSYKNQLDEKVFTSLLTQNHLFLFKGIARHDLSRVIGFQPIEFSGQQLKKITVQFILLELVEDYEKLLKNTSQPVHVIQYKENNFFWVKSSNKLKVIHEFLKADGAETLSEDEMLSRFTSSTPPFSVSIADSPGMGKTLLAQNLASKITALNAGAVVLFIVLQELIQNISSVGSLGSAISQLASFVCPNTLSALIFEEMMMRGKDVIYMFLDGYDEILENKLELADSFLGDIKNLRNTRIIVTTRPHLKSRLENIFNNFSYEILPFNKSNQIEFLTKYWISQYEAIEGKKLTRFAEICLESLKLKLSDNEKQIAGIPLQCMMIAEVFAEDATRVSTLNKIPDYLHDSLSFYELYKSLVELKFKKVSNDLTEHGSKVRENYMNAHVHAAILLLFPEWMNVFKPCLEGHENINEGTLYLIGLLEKNSNTITHRFLHRTFAEFIFSGFLVRNLGKYHTCVEFLFKELLGYKGVIKKEWKDGLRCVELKHQVIAYFVELHLHNSDNDVLPSLNSLNQINIEAEDVCIACSACCRHNLESTFGLTTKILHQTSIKSNEVLRDTYFKSMPHVAVRSSKSLFLLQNLLEFTKLEFGVDFSYHEHVNKLSNNIQTPLHLALINWNYNVVSYLLKEYGNEVVKMQGLLHYCVHDSGWNSDSVIKEKLSTIDLLLQLKPEWLMESFDNGWVPISSDNIHVKLAQRLVERGADINGYSSNWGTVLHRASMCGTHSNYRNVVRWALSNGFNLINHRGQYGRTPVMTAIFHLKVLDDDVLHLLHEAGADFNAQDENGRSVLHYAIAQSNNLDFVKRILDYGARVSSTSKWEVNEAHTVVRFVKDSDLAISYLQLLESKGFQGYSQQNSENCTPLELALKLRGSDEELINYLTGKTTKSTEHDRSRFTQLISFQILSIVIREFFFIAQSVLHFPGD